jgi:hypothetical protein
MRDQLALCNAALSELPADAIPNFDDNSKEAVECRRHYEPALADLLSHAWRWSSAFAVLAEIENDRPGEWRRAYRIPQNFGTLRNLAPSGSTGALLHQATAGLGNMVAFPRPALLVPHEIVGQTLYSNADTMSVEYGLSATSVANMPAPVARAFELLLAERICLPIIKSRARKLELAQQYRLAWEQAVAWDKNMVPAYYHTVMPGTDAAWSTPTWPRGSEEWLAWPAVTGR